VCRRRVLQARKTTRLQTGNGCAFLAAGPGDLASLILQARDDNQSESKIMIQRNLLRRAAGSRGRLAATGSQPPYYRTEQARDSSAATTAARSEVAAASCAGVHVMPMTSTTITMISGIRRRSSSSRCVRLAGGVLVKALPSDRWTVGRAAATGRRLAASSSNSSEFAEQLA
jgi:hypothetical protein